MFRFSQNNICIAVDYRCSQFELDYNCTISKIKNSGFHQLLGNSRPLLQHQLHARLLACDAFIENGVNELSEIKYSISHTKNAAAVCWTTSKDLKNVGVDIEPVTRCLPSASAKFFINEHDCFNELNYLEFWCIKEAAFKCLDNFEQVLNLTSIRVVPLNDKVYHAHTNTIGCECTLIPNSSGYIIAAAWR